MINLNLLTFSSIYLLKPIAWLYNFVVNKLIKRYEFKRDVLILIRQTAENKFTSSDRNIGGIDFGRTNDEMDALSLKLYQYLQDNKQLDQISFNKVPLYNIYTRQVQLKLLDVIKCALQLYQLTIKKEKIVEVVSDLQTIAVINVIFDFLEVSSGQIKWNKSFSLTLLVIINSIVMRMMAIIKTGISKSKFPRVYYLKQVKASLPTILVTLPSTSPEKFFSSYLENFSEEFNIVMYSLKQLNESPAGYKKNTIFQGKHIFKGRVKLLGSQNIKSYISDILLINTLHTNLGVCMDVVDAVYNDNKIDILINRQQVNMINNQLVNEAKKRKIYVMCDVFEEVYFCDSAVIASNASNTLKMQEVLRGNPPVIRQYNELIKYRLHGWSAQSPNYLHTLFDKNESKCIIFYASDPGKDLRQRYEAELFLFQKFSYYKDEVLVVKTHSQDDGSVTLLAYKASGSPSNVELVGDFKQKSRMSSKYFNFFPDFDFNTAIKTSNGFITTSSSSILQAVTLDIKAGVLDLTGHGMYRELINNCGALLIDSEKSLESFMETLEWHVSVDALNFYGLGPEPVDGFNIGEHLLALYNANNNISKTTAI